MNTENTTPQVNDEKAAQASPRVSVVIPTRNRPWYLQRLLASLDLLSGHSPYEVIVVDDSSTLETLEVLEIWLRHQHIFTPRVLKQSPPRGPGQARNMGIRAAMGDIVAFTDDDCQVHPRWLANLLRALDGNPEIVGAGGRVLPVRNDLISKYYTLHRILEPPSSKLYLVSANCCYRIEPLVEVGGFEEGMRNPGGEDVGLSFRLSRAGWKFALSENAIVFHDFRNSLFDFCRTFRNYGRGCREVTERHFGQGRPT